MCRACRQSVGAPSVSWKHGRKSSVKRWLRTPCALAISSSRRNNGRNRKSKGQGHTQASSCVGISGRQSVGSPTGNEVVYNSPRKPAPGLERQCWRYYVQSIQRSAWSWKQASTATQACFQRLCHWTSRRKH